MVKGVAQDWKLFDDSPVHPGKLLQRMLDERGWTHDEFAEIAGKTRATISQLISGKTRLMPDMAVVLAAAFTDTTATEWMKWDAAYRLHQVEHDVLNEVQRRARLYQVAPVRDMQKRGWIADTKEPDALERELKGFFGVESLDGEIAFPVATRRAASLRQLNPAELAWCFRARQLAAALHLTGAFVPNRLDATAQKLRTLAAYPKEARHLATVLSAAGIRLVAVELLPGAKIDGAAFWLDEHSPVIAVSVRYDRIDAFWFTVMHEFSHVRHGDALSVDTDLVGDDSKATAMVLVEDEQERRANDEAAAALVSPSELDSFIRRVGPLYAKTRIVQFAHRMKIHPGIIVGQLHHRGEISFRTNREMLAKVRDAITETTLTDGWGRTISPGIL
jgi:HTH-type transcriptional regulator/antitoxin HigA